MHRSCLIDLNGKVHPTCNVCIWLCNNDAARPASSNGHCVLLQNEISFGAADKISNSNELIIRQFDHFANLYDADDAVDVSLKSQ